MYIFDKFDGHHEQEGPDPSTAQKKEGGRLSLFYLIALVP